MFTQCSHHLLCRDLSLPKGKRPFISFLGVWDFRNEMRIVSKSGYAFQILKFTSSWVSIPMMIPRYVVNSFDMLAYVDQVATWNLGPENRDTPTSELFDHTHIAFHYLLGVKSTDIVYTCLWIMPKNSFTGAKFISNFPNRRLSNSCPFSSLLLELDQFPGF